MMSEIDKIIYNYHEHQQQEREESRGSFLEVCRKYGVANVEIEFDGYGDEGSVSITTEHDPEVMQAAEDYAYHLMEEHYPGWEINEGSTGTIRIDLDPGKVAIEFGARVEAVEWSGTEVKL